MNKKKKKTPKIKTKITQRIRRIWDAFMEKSIPVYCFVILLGVADFLVMMNLFYTDETTLTMGECILYSLVLACGLEGFPSIASSSLAKIKDHNVPRKSVELSRARIVFTVSIIMTLALFVGVFLLRYMQIQYFGGFKEYKAKTYRGDGSEGQFLIDWFLAFEPIISSMLAFGATFYWMKNDSLREAKSKSERSYRDANEKYRLYSDKKCEFDSRRNALLNEVLAGTGNTQSKDTFPDDWEECRPILYDLVRDYVDREGYNMFITMVMRYNTTVESQLKRSLTRMKTVSTVPGSVVALDFDAFLKAYDNRVEEYQKWLLTNCEPYLRKMLWKLLIEHPLDPPEGYESKRPNTPSGGAGPAESKKKKNEEQVIRDKVKNGNGAQRKNGTWSYEKTQTSGYTAGFDTSNVTGSGHVDTQQNTGEDNIDAMNEPGNNPDNPVDETNNDRENPKAE